MILEVDVGNTRIKWRTLLNGAVTDRGAVLKNDIGSWLSNLEQTQVPDSIRFSCVADKNLAQQLVEQGKRWGCLVQEAVSKPFSAGVHCGYSNPDSLGVDRWLAIVAAYCQFQQPCVVVDAGSALTVDLVDGQGKHLGGYIVPGLAMMHQALFKGTSQVKVDTVAEASIAPGSTTDEAVTHGSLLMIKAMIDAAVGSISSKGVAAKVVITGGDGEYLLGVLDKEACYLPELVMDGLALVVSEE